MLDARGNGVIDVRFFQLGADALLNALQELLVLFALRLQTLDDLVVADRIEYLERQILQLPLDAAHAESVRDRRIDLHGLQRLVALLALGQVLERARIVQPVRQLDQDHADVLRHGKEHLTQILELLLLLGIAQHTQPGNAVYQLRNRRAEFVFDLLIAECGILDTVMQQRRTDGVRIQTHLHYDLGHCDRMNDIRLAVSPLLPLVCSSRALICRTNLSEIRLRILFLYSINQKFQFILHRIFPHSRHPAILCNVASTTEPDMSAFPS